MIFESHLKTVDRINWISGSNEKKAEPALVAASVRNTEKVFNKFKLVIAPGVKGKARKNWILRPWL
jgi:hypothetical protein